MSTPHHNQTVSIREISADDLYRKVSSDHHFLPWKKGIIEMICLCLGLKRVTKYNIVLQTDVFNIMVMKNLLVHKCAVMLLMDKQQRIMENTRLK